MLAFSFYILLSVRDFALLLLGLEATDEDWFLINAAFP